MKLTRRALLGGLLAQGAGTAIAAPTSSQRPKPRPDDVYESAIPSVQSLVDGANLNGEVSFAVADARTGQILESRGPTLGQPPASTAKAMTTLYALDRLGPDHRFTTRLVATGPLRNGRLEGDLILLGGGDPTLDTDDLAAMASQLKDRGLREIAGRFRVSTGDIPETREIDVEQPDHVGYNPGVGGLNLNFNRVHFEWTRKGGDYVVTMEARAPNYSPGVTMARMDVVDRTGPVYTYADREGRDEWTVARGALGDSGARWLPVRRPALYCGDAFLSVARSFGINLGTEVAVTPGRVSGDVLAAHDSAPLTDILRDMLKYSTNLTAEAVGLAASLAGGPPPATLADSAQRMSEWLFAQFSITSARFEDHSGLGDDTRISAGDMVRAIVAAGPDSRLRSLMKDFPIEGRGDLDIDAKTGTLNFVSALTGYVGAADGTDLAFAIFCTDIDRRDALTVDQRERPEGGRYWLGRARNLQRELISRWALMYTS
ncbi:D-alanyl-D-alanine carboxypeptidase/D-alanyl-D-alanine-endopeptidase [Mesobaculum littorinae]|uniref:D-alanyl-D-alanine carboxypeptidase/D-alanyl-D-alanine-endopeptidase n=1 Tax=Mesobaculum littorinae TaxID=2486419 RepID=A0A438AGE2_9RHOB|nr:D-alanyl-D-alanine carboxypeptidase/D-alanyl-D-alanine-endopeptidase [Mesobaculum littorinae]RVV97768.1 D-alanyl-D-alanine carboxypeptidase/D-alanyl-D-alanine-endopeptidase [Mesobaculum littorinae]